LWLLISLIRRPALKVPSDPNNSADLNGFTDPNDSADLSGFADLDFAREERCGFPEVVYGAGKTPEQVATIMTTLAARHGVVLCTRASSEQADATRAVVPDIHYLPSCNMLFADRRGRRETSGDGTHIGSTGGIGSISGTTVDEVLACPGGIGSVVVCCAGTSDLAVAQEAAITARLMGSSVALLADVGISGVHRVLSHTDELHNARAIVAVAGMEGALPSLIAGLVDVPVVAVPTSVGYGASFGGIAALLGMLNSCAGGVSVVNIDNGFGAGVVAHRINVPPTRFTNEPS
jgi:NCAIR mutase (PurE)-related protein